MPKRNKGKAKKASKSERAEGGAWGYRLFQSDHDYDIVREMSSIMGLDKLEDEDARTGKISVDPKVLAEKRDRTDARAIEERFEDSVSYLMYSGLCSDVPRVRAHLNRGGLLRELLERTYRAYLERINDNVKDTKPDPGFEDYTYSKSGYLFVVIGACGMSLGCQLRDFKEKMREVYKNVGLMRDALQQIEQATSPDQGYRDGTPWAFGSKGLKVTIQSGAIAPRADRLVADQVNVRAPGVDNKLTAEVLRSMHLSREDPSPKTNEDGSTWDPTKKEGDFMSITIREGGDPPKCGVCGATEGCSDSKNLLTCSRCKRQKYCGRNCQKLHWAVHKHNCPTIEQQVYMQVKERGRAPFTHEAGDSADTKRLRAKRAFFARVDPDLMYHYVNQKLYDMTLETNGKDGIAALPPGWEQVHQRWYRQKPPYGDDPEDEREIFKLLYMTSEAAETYPKVQVEIMMLIMRDMTRGIIEGFDAALEFPTSKSTATNDRPMENQEENSKTNKAASEPEESGGVPLGM